MRQMSFSEEGLVAWPNPPSLRPCSWCVLGLGAGGHDAPATRQADENDGGEKTYIQAICQCSRNRRGACRPPDQGARAMNCPRSSHALDAGPFGLLLVVEGGDVHAVVPCGWLTTPPSWPWFVRNHTGTTRVRHHLDDKQKANGRIQDGLDRGQFIALGLVGCRKLHEIRLQWQIADRLSPASFCRLAVHGAVMPPAPRPRAPRAWAKRWPDSPRLQTFFQKKLSGACWPGFLLSLQLVLIERSTNLPIAIAEAARPDHQPRRLAASGVASSWWQRGGRLVWQVALRKTDVFVAAWSFRTWLRCSRPLAPDAFCSSRSSGAWHFAYGFGAVAHVLMMNRSRRAVPDRPLAFAPDHGLCISPLLLQRQARGCTRYPTFSPSVFARSRLLAACSLLRHSMGEEQRPLPPPRDRRDSTDQGPVRQWRPFSLS